MTKNEYLDKVQWLNDRTKEYEIGCPTVSDRTWDDVYFEIQKYEFNHPEDISPWSPTQIIQFNKVSELKKVKHNHPMLSLNKTKDIEEVKSFLGGHPYIIMAKMDGLTCSLHYEGGKLVSAETRGNGTEGEDITHNALVIPSIPNKIKYTEPLTVDGEIICTYSDFKEVGEGYKNPRNFAAGSIRLLDSKECKERKLTFVAWDIIEGLDWTFFSSKLHFLHNLGFLCVPAIENGDEGVEKEIEHVKELVTISSYPIDGIVFKYELIKEYEAAGRTDHHFKGGLAYKFYDEEYETRLKYIDYDVSRNGILTPVAVFEPIEIDGSTVERCSLFNLSVLKEKLGKPYVGQKIWVCKRNMIIPYIERAEKIS